MIEKERPPLTREMLSRYFLEACRPRAEWLLGMEFEVMGVDRDGGRRIPYDGARASVRSVLERYLEQRAGQPVYEGDNLIGLDADWGTISLEPGGQVEWSSRPRRTLAELDDDLVQHAHALDAIGDDLGIRWLETALDPSTPLERVSWMPKARYRILAPYLGSRGRLAHRMMKQTTSIQCAFDYADPDDWARKFRVAALLAPVAVALFANSRELDGIDTGYRSYRQRIWTETDPDRCGLPPVVFEPGFDLERWLEWALDTPAIFLRRARGLVPAGGESFRNLMRRTGCHAVRREDWELHLSAIFTDVRAYSYIEVRTADLQPRETIMAVPALWTGLLYDDHALEAALRLGAAHDDHDAWRQAMHSAARDGLEGSAGGVPLRRLASETLGLATSGLRRSDAFAGDVERALQPLRRLADRHGLDLPAGR